MSVEAHLAPYLNRFVILLRQNSVAKLELSCNNGKLTVNISHDMGVVEQATPKANTPTSYNEVLKNNLNISQTNRLQRRAADRAEKANKEAEQAHAQAAKANRDMEDVAEKARTEAEEARSEIEKFKSLAEKTQHEAEKFKTEAKEAKSEIEKARNEGLHRAATLTTKLNNIKVTLAKKDDELLEAQNVIMTSEHQTDKRGNQRKVMKSTSCN